MENNKFATLIEEAEAKYDKVRFLSEIYDKLYGAMQWDTMQYHEPDDEHEDRWFTEPEPDDWTYKKYQVYKEVLAAIEKLAK